MKKAVSLVLFFAMVLAVAGCGNNTHKEYILENGLPLEGSELPFDIAVSGLKPNYSCYSKYYASVANSDNNGTISIEGTIKASDESDHSFSKEVKIILYAVNEEYPIDAFSVEVLNTTNISHDFTGLGTSSDYFIQVINTTETEPDSKVDVDIILTLK